MWVGLLLISCWHGNTMVLAKFMMIGLFNVFAKSAQAQWAFVPYSFKILDGDHNKRCRWVKTIDIQQYGLIPTFEYIYGYGY